MRQTLSILLVSLLLVQGLPLAAHDPDSTPTLEERLRNMDAEVERFVRLKTDGSGDLLLEQEEPATGKSTEAERVRTRLLSLESNTKITVILRDGETVHGELSAVENSSFQMWAKLSGSRSARREYRFDEVKSLLYPRSPEKANEIAIGKRVEAVLLNGEKLRGQLLNVSEQGFTLSTRKGPNLDLTFDEILTVRKLGMRTVYSPIVDCIRPQNCCATARQRPK
jgi:small nuclear ribonucleoprotein (snRNP)-like protein